MTPPDGLALRGGGRVASGFNHARKRCKAHRRLQIYLLMAGTEIGAILFAFEAARRLLPDQAVQGGSAIVLALLHVALAFQFGAYGLQALRRWTWGLRMTLSALFLSLLVVFGIISAGGADHPPSWTFLLAILGLTAGSITLGRHLVGRIARHLLPDGPIEVVVIADDPTPAIQLGYEVIEASLLRDACALDCPHALDRLGQAVWRADRVLVACAVEDRQLWVTALKGSGIDVELMLPEFETLGVLSIDRHQGRLTACVAKSQLALRQRMLKRVFDILVVLWLLPLLVMTLLLVSLAIKLDDGGPVFFVQRRIGQGNRFFDLIKFRTMRVDMLDGVGMRSTGRNDVRVTRVGDFLRRTSMDELPQLINVALGSMSIVGPRPHAPGSTAEDQLFWTVDQRYWLRHAAKPGLTGLAQVRGFRGATDNTVAVTNRIQADLEYIAGWSLWRDMRILAATVSVLVHPNAF